MKRFDDKGYWLKKMEVKEMCSERDLVERMIIDIGKDICNDLIKEKYSKMVINSVS
jgi:hypothetical protein